MLIALDKRNGERINILSYANVHLDLSPTLRENLICPVTEQKVYPTAAHTRNSKSVRAYFSVAPSKDEDKQRILSEYEIDNDLFAQRGDRLHYRESLEHAIAKIEVAKYLKSKFPVYKAARYEYEHLLVLPNGKKRIIDVACILPSGDIYAHEIQLSRISVSDLEARTDDYSECGVNVFWWFGKAAKTQQNLSWWQERTTELPLTLDFHGSDRPERRSSQDDAKEDISIVEE